MQWITSTSEEQSICPICETKLNGYTPKADHHAIVCPCCGESLVVFSTSARSVLIAVNRCPEELRRFLVWSQCNLDELEFVSLIVTLEEILIYSTIAPGSPWQADSPK